MTNWIQTRSGGWNFDTMAWIGDFNLREDIAETLAAINRFKGSTRYPWPVAAHACVMTRTAMALGYEPAVSFAMLRHDNHEAVTGDIPSPLVRVIGNHIIHLQDEIQVALDQLEGVPVGWRSQDHKAVVKNFDMCAFHVERFNFMSAPVLPIPPHTDAELYNAMRTQLTQFLYGNYHADGGAKEYLRLYEELSWHYRDGSE